MKSIKIFYEKLFHDFFFLPYFSNFIAKIKTNSWNHISNEFRVLWQYSASKAVKSLNGVYDKSTIHARHNIFQRVGLVW